MHIFKTSGFKLAYETWGEPTDRAVLFFHGFPGSHVQAQGMARYLDHEKLFLIAADRPGYGGTEGNGDYLSHLDALYAMLDQLGISRFDIVGISGGSPWAHMMASRFADNVRSLTIVCGLGPMNDETLKYFSAFQKRGLRLRKIVPTALAEMIIAGALRNFDSETRLEHFSKILSAPDIASIHVPINRRLLVLSLEQARQQNGKGIANDASLYHRDWLHRYCDEERLAKIPTYYFHGLKDQILNPKMSEWMHKRQPHSRLRLFENEGHYSLPLCQGKAILHAVHESHR